MNLGPNGIELIHGFEKCMLKAYPDPGSEDGTPWTIGWGHTGPEVKKGLVWTRAECDAAFVRDVVKREPLLNQLLGKKVVTQNEYDALFSFGYNAGFDVDDDNIPEGLGDAVFFYMFMNGQKAAAAERWKTSWIKNDGKIMEGLKRRRLAESAMFIGGNWRQYL